MDIWNPPRMHAILTVKLNFGVNCPFFNVDFVFFTAFILYIFCLAGGCVCVYTHTSRFSGLMSRWTMFIRCRYLMAPARLNTMALASRSLYFVDEVMASNRSPPWKEAETWTQEEQEVETGNRRRKWRGGTLTSSITKNSWLGVSSTSINWMMLGCRTLRNTATSFSIRCSYEDVQNVTITSSFSLISPELHRSALDMWSRNVCSSLTFPQQRALSMIFRAYSCPVDLSVKQIGAIIHQAILILE